MNLLVTRGFKDSFNQELNSFNYDQQRKVGENPVNNHSN